MKKVTFLAFAWTEIVSKVLAVVSGVQVVVMLVYAFFAYEHSWFTTDPEYVHLSKAAPEIWNFTLILIFTFFISIVLAFISGQVAEKLLQTKRR